MKLQINESALELVVGNITTQDVDAIVNAANSSLLGGGGVDGAIHKAAGSDLLTACQLLDGCLVGKAKITPGFNLKARWIIHAVGPVYQDHKADICEKLLGSAYRSSLVLALRVSDIVKVKSVAFPAISTGIYGYPMVEAANISLKTVIKFLSFNAGLETVRFVLFDQVTCDIFEKSLRDLT